MAQRHTGRFFGALALLAVFLPLSTMAGCKLLNKEKKAFGEDCQSDEDCESVECATYGSVCTKSCTFDKECGAGFVCRAHDGRPGQSCAKPVGVPAGQACNNAAECQSGNCLKPVGQNDALGFCSTYCDTEAECPENYKMCLSISDSGQLKFCLPGGGGSANIPGSVEPPKFAAPRPVVTTTKTATTAPTATATAALTATTQPTATTAVTATTTTTATTAAPTTTASTRPTTNPSATTKPTGTTSVKRPPIILKPKK